jgi:retron-type reverse transcriptase
MKRVGSLFDTVFSKDNLYSAYIDARRGKRKKRACFQFEIQLGTNLGDIYEEIHSGRYKPKPYFKFIIYEPKERIIHAPAFRDIVVQHAIYRITYPVFNSIFIDSSFACRLGYGTHKASRFTQDALRVYSNDDYFLKLDIRKFFYSIDRKVLREQIERKIKDKRLVDMMMLFADKEEPVGIPIGNLLSQIYALIYLNPLDHFVKRVLKVKHSVRYVDDFILIGLTREKCLEYKVAIIDFIRNKLGLGLSKFTIQKIKHGINFAGYRTWKNRTLIRKYSLYKFKRSVKAGKQESVISLLGHAKRSNSLAYMLNMIKQAANPSAIILPKSYRQTLNKAG